VLVSDWCERKGDSATVSGGKAAHEGGSFLRWSRHEWDRQWRMFMERRGSPVPAKMPTITGTVFDPYGMFRQVLRYGGWRQVVRGKKMHQVVKGVGVINRHGGENFLSLGAEL
jgi:hypothetical protein